LGGVAEKLWYGLVLVEVNGKGKYIRGLAFEGGRGFWEGAVLLSFVKEGMVAGREKPVRMNDYVFFD
jgi:hypothetical protein